jgi:hypothetical protein
VNVLQKSSSLTDENSVFYTKNTVRIHVVVGRHLDLKNLKRIQKYKNPKRIGPREVD